MMEKIPCQDCLMIPICRFKNYWKLFADCILIRQYSNKKHNMIHIQNILKPMTWTMEVNKKQGTVTSIVMAKENEYITAKYTELDDSIEDSNK